MRCKCYHRKGFVKQQVTKQDDAKLFAKGIFETFIILTLYPLGVSQVDSHLCLIYALRDATAFTVNAALVAALYMKLSLNPIHQCRAKAWTGCLSSL